MFLRIRFFLKETYIQHYFLYKIAIYCKIQKDFYARKEKNIK